jgi:hypothetical protein
MPNHNTPPKWDVPLITQKDPNKVLARWDNDSKQTTKNKYMMRQPTYTNSNTQNK